MTYKGLAIAGLLVLLIFGNGHAESDGATTFRSPLDTSAVPIAPSRLPQQASNAIAVIEHRIVAVGWRGLIIYSDDQGRSWQQAEVPVQVDLTSVIFDQQGQGWASGHDQLILHSQDKGATWKKLFDNQDAGRLALIHYKSYQGDERYDAMAQQALMNTQDGWTLPIVDLHIESDGYGYAIGTFGSVHITDNAGKTWVPGYEYVDNQRFLNLNTITEVDGFLYIAGEGGLVYRLNRESRRFVALETGYEGSFYGLTGDSSNLYAFGLRGTVYHSKDSGLSWQRVPSTASGLLSTGVPAPGAPGNFLIFSYDGQVFEVGDGGKLFREVEVSDPNNYVDATSYGGDLIAVSGKHGVQVISYKGGMLQLSESDHE